MQPAPEPSPDLIDDLVVGNRILFKYQVVDAFGHISVRHDKDPNRYLMSRHLAPGLVTGSDIVTFDLDSVPIVDIKQRYYGERFIHGEIYKARPDVLAVVHCHAPALLPFGVTKTPLLPIYHMSAFLGSGVPVFEIRATAGMTDMLVRTPALGAALAASIGDRPMVLMRGHGATMVGKTIAEVVYRSIYATQNAAIELEALRLGDVTFLAPEEAALYEEYSAGVMHRPWNLWKAEALAGDGA